MCYLILQFSKRMVLVPVSVSGGRAKIRCIKEVKHTTEVKPEGVEEEKGKDRIKELGWRAGILLSVLWAAYQFYCFVMGFGEMVERVKGWPFWGRLLDFWEIAVPECDKIGKVLPVVATFIGLFVQLWCWLKGMKEEKKKKIEEEKRKKAILKIMEHLKDLF